MSRLVLSKEVVDKIIANLSDAVDGLKGALMVDQKTLPGVDMESGLQFSSADVRLPRWYDFDDFGTGDMMVNSPNNYFYQLDKIEYTLQDYKDEVKQKGERSKKALETKLQGEELKYEAITYDDIPDKGIADELVQLGVIPPPKRKVAVSKPKSPPGSPLVATARTVATKLKNLGQAASRRLTQGLQAGAAAFGKAGIPTRK